jgi:hypothetical protein
MEMIWVLSDDRVMKHLNLLLAGSDPGDEAHGLHVVSVEADAVGPLGAPSEDQLKTAIYAIIADTQPGVSVEDFITRVITGAAIDHGARGEQILFAILAQEMWSVVGGDDLAVELSAQGRLREHPRAAEVTVVYGACADGRRWRGRRWLTGPQAGETEGVEVLTGPAQRNEGQGIANAPLIRRLVGLPR